MAWRARVAMAMAALSGAAACNKVVKNTSEASPPRTLIVTSGGDVNPH